MLSRTCARVLCETEEKAANFAAIEEDSKVMPQARIATEKVPLKVADNTTMQAYVARPLSGGRAVIEALDAQRKIYVNVVFSNADDAFFCDKRPAYEPIAARQAWRLTLEFLRS